MGLDYNDSSISLGWNFVPDSAEKGVIDRFGTLEQSNLTDRENFIQTTPNVIPIWNLDSLLVF